jgi:hypothetical protein
MSDLIQLGPSRQGRNDATVYDNLHKNQYPSFVACSVGEDCDRRDHGTTVHR